MNVKPLAGYVLVEPKEAQTRTASGIILPESATEEKPQEGKVLATGEALVIDGKTVECPVKSGDTVIYKKWGTNEIKVGDKEYFLIKFEDLMAVVAESQDTKSKVKNK